MERVILHSDLNNFYASVECLYNPELRNYPVAVTGDPELRHGIILAKNNIAKKYGVKTGEPLWKAKQKCRDIIFVKPDYDKYMKFSKIAREIYAEYTNQVEPFGPDECWLDLTDNIGKLADGKYIADKIREQIKFEMGITASVGVSYNKLFAKLASDMKKPDATTVIKSTDYKEKVWPLPAEDLLFIGRSTGAMLNKIGITTIGGIANAKLQFLEQVFGKNGITMWGFANGLDTSPVATTDAEPIIKSIGNGTTAPRDLVSDDDIRITLYILCESVSARLREQNFNCRTVQLGVRDKNLATYERQAPIEPSGRTTKALFDKVYELFKKHHTSGIPVRSLCVRACNLFYLRNEQMCFPELCRDTMRQEAIDTTIDDLRGRYGTFSIRRGVTLLDKELSHLDPKSDHILHPDVFVR